MLEELCLQILEEKPGALEELLKDNRIQSLVMSAVHKVLAVYNYLDRNETIFTCQYLLWQEIYQRYIPANDKKKSDNLVLRFIKTRLYRRLMDEVRPLVTDFKLTYLDKERPLQPGRGKAGVEENATYYTLVPDTSVDLSGEVTSKSKLDSLNRTITLRISRDLLDPLHIFIFSLRVEIGLSILQIQEKLSSLNKINLSTHQIRRILDKTQKTLEEIYYA